MIKKFVTAGTLAASLVLALPAHAAEMGATGDTIKLAINEWTGQHVTTHIAGELLKKAGYKVEYVTAGYGPQFTAMADGSLHATLEIWTSNVPDLWGKERDKGTVVEISGLGLEAREGFVYPVHVKKICPGLPDMEALKKCAAKFATAETVPKGRLLDYPADWGSPGGDRIKALGLPFKAVPAGSEGALISELKASVAKKSPIIAVFWQPHWLLSKLDVEWVALPKAEQACYDDPKWGSNPNAKFDCDFIRPHIFKAAWKGFEKKWPAAYKILDAYKLTAAQQQPLMGAIDSDGKKLDATVKAWVDANEAIWKPWLDKAKM